MPFKKNSPGCPCCESCEIAISGWNQVAGTWTASSGSVSTEDSNSLVVTTNEHSGSTHYIEALVQGDEDGDVVRLIVTYEDADNYLFGEIEFGDDCGYVRLYKRVSGTNTQLGVDVPSVNLQPGETHEVHLCYDGELLTIVVIDNVAYSQAVTETGTRVGVATGNIEATGAGRVTEFEWWIHNDQDNTNCPYCVLPCRIFADTFNRSNSTDLGCVWNEVSGGWQISSNKLACTSVGTLICTVPQSTDDTDGGHYALTVFSTGFFSTGHKVRLIADASSDGSAYYGVEVEVLSNKIRLYKSGTLLVERELPTIGTGETITLELCVYANYIVGICSRSGSAIGSVAIADDRLNNRYSGLITSGGTTPTFTSFIFERTSRPNTLDDCVDCQSSSDCGDCKDDVSPQYMKVVFSGVADDSCSDCEIFNQTYLLPLGSGQKCDWILSFAADDGDDVPCGGTEGYYGVSAAIDKVQVTFPPDPITYESRLLVGIALGYKPPGSGTFVFHDASFLLTSEDEFSCLQFEDLDVPFNTQSGGKCDFSAATCTISSI